MSSSSQPPLWVLIPDILLPQPVFEATSAAQREASFVSLPATLKKTLARQQATYQNACGLDRIEAFLLRYLESAQPIKFDQYPPWAMLQASHSEAAPASPYCRWWGTVGHIELQRDGVRLLPPEVLQISGSDLQAYWTVVLPILNSAGWKLASASPGEHALLDSEQPLPIEQASPWSVQQVRLTDYLPMRDDCSDWRRMWLNLQVELNNAPFNQDREARGLKPLNCLWFWGGGEVWETERAMPVLKSVSADGVYEANTLTPEGNQALNRLVFWKDRLSHLTSNRREAGQSTLYVVDFEGWGSDTGGFGVLESEVLGPMRMAGLAFQWALMGQEGWSVLPMDWRSRLKFWKNQPNWATLTEPVQDSGPTEQDMEQAWEAGQAQQDEISKW